MALTLSADADLLVFSGRLDAAGAMTLDAWQTQADSIPVIWDLRALEFISSLGIRGLMTLDRRLRKQGQRAQLVLTAASIVADVFSVSGLDTQWPTHADVSTARGALASPADASRPDHWTGTAGTRYRRTPARDRGSVSVFQAAPDAPPMLLRFDELGLAMGAGDFSAGPADAHPGALFATGQTVLVRTTDGLTDLLDTMSPKNTFAHVADAVRLDLNDGERWDAEQAVRWGSLLADLHQRAVDLGVRHWAAGVACAWEGRQSVIAIYATDASGDIASRVRVMGLCAAGSPAAGGAATLEEAAVAVAGATDVAIMMPDEGAMLTDARVWFAADPVVIDGATQRLQIDAPEPLPDAWERIIRAAFAEAASVRLRRLTGGFMASTFATETRDRQGRRTLPSVIKISPRAVTAREEAAHRDYVRPFILNNSTVLMGHAAHGEYAGLRYNFVGITGNDSRLQPMQSLYLGDDFPAAMTAIQQTLTNVLHPWFGQAVVGSVQPFASHDPRGLFTTLPEVAHDVLGLDIDDPFMDCAPLGRRVLNPYHFLRHRWDAMLSHTASWSTSITHGDLNLNNVLVDERGNIYVIDFSETKVRNVAADFARLEAIAMLQHTRMSEPGDGEAVLAQVVASLRAPIWDYTPAVDAADPMLVRATTLASSLRQLASQRVADRSHEAAYLFPLLEWSIPIVAFQQVERERKQVAAWASGLILERIMALAA